MHKNYPYKCQLDASLDVASWTVKWVESVSLSLKLHVRIPPLSHFFFFSHYYTTNTKVLIRALNVSKCGRSR